MVDSCTLNHKQPICQFVLYKLLAPTFKVASCLNEMIMCSCSCNAQDVNPYSPDDGVIRSR